MGQYESLYIDGLTIEGERFGRQSLGCVVAPQEGIRRFQQVSVESDRQLSETAFSSQIPMENERELPFGVSDEIVEALVPDLSELGEPIASRPHNLGAVPLEQPRVRQLGDLLVLKHSHLPVGQIIQIP